MLHSLIKPSTEAKLGVVENILDKLVAVSKPLHSENKLYTFDGKEVTHNITQEGVKKETAVINSSNKMLDEAADKAQSTHKLPQSQKDKKIIEGHNAIVENKQITKRHYGNNLQKLDFNEIEKALENQIAKLENKNINI